VGNSRRRATQVARRFSFFIAEEITAPKFFETDQLWDFA
jgi:hypothetical protein